MSEFTISGDTFRVVQGDITEQETDAVVNAANKQLRTGGGVAGAIHSAAGPELEKYCLEHFDGCETGEAVITPGFELSADHVIHTVGPVYDQHPEPEKALRDCYRHSLDVAEREGLDSVSFCAISTGVFGYPMEEAARVAVEEIKQFLSGETSLNEVRMVLLSEQDRDTVVNVAREVLNSGD